MKTLKPLAATMALTVCNAQAADVEDRIAELEAQIAELKALVMTNQGTLAIHETTIMANADEIEEVRPTRTGTQFDYGGYIQLDALASSYSDGKPANTQINDFLVGPLMPVAGDSADSFQSFNVHAKTSRFHFGTRTDTDAGRISTLIELDFMLSKQGDERISNSWSSRIRHAYVNWDYSENSSLLAGQAWSTFVNVAALADTIDLVGPVGTVFNRQPMIRWSTGGLQLALENPATRLNQYEDGVNSTRLDDAETFPDLVARYNGQTGELSWSIAGIGRELAYETRSDSATERSSDTTYGYGLSFSGKWHLGERDDLRFMFNYGDALGRYLGLNSYNDGYIDADGKIQKIDQIGAFIAYQHYWTERWRSTFSLSASQADNPTVEQFFGADELAKSYQSFHGNLNYFPAPRLQLGGELIYGRKKLEDGRAGDLHRLQFAVKYAI